MAGWQHSFLHCNMAHSVWALEDINLVDSVECVREPDAKRWIFSLLEEIPHADFVKVLVTLWAIWHSRRKALHEQIFQSPFVTHNFVKNYIRELEECKLKRIHGPALAVQRRSNMRWIPPAPGISKIRVDGACSRVNSEGTFSAVCRDSNDKYLGSSVVIIAGVTDPAPLEALACREHLALVLDLSITHVVIASDC